VSIIISNYIYHMRFVAHMAVPFITFFHIFSLRFISVYTLLHVLHASV